MTSNRYKELMADDTAQLTDAEIAAGWHFCQDYDGLLVGPGMMELSVCRCLFKNHTVYRTLPNTGPITGTDALGVLGL